MAPHRLFGTIDGAIACSAATWADAARTAINEAHRAGVLPILVGGTGLYINTLLNGIAPIPDIDPAIRQAVRAMAVGDAYAALTGEDSTSAARLAPADTTRVARALEVVRSTGAPLSHWHARRVGGISETMKLAPLIVLPPREWLLARCDARFAAMFENGAAQEVAALVARKLDRALPVMRAIGVREVAAYLAGETDAETATASAQLATRQYAKRQNTWFNNQAPGDWLRVRQEINNENVIDLAIKLRRMVLTL